jgi:hypothetical protein
MEKESLYRGCFFGTVSQNFFEVRILWRLLFPRQWEMVWAMTGFHIGETSWQACTGMSAGEIPGLWGKYIFDEYIHVQARHDEYGRRPAKTREKRNF